ncbi:MAG: hypothetical protein H0T94_05630, partial [Acidimicrobiia bacterium]|nr:hypothetical protein [Acidimicrobiia bacterium]
MSGTVLVESDGFVYVDAVDFAEAEVRRLEAHIRRLRGRQVELLANWISIKFSMPRGRGPWPTGFRPPSTSPPQASARLMTAARTDLPQVREKMLAGSGIDRAAVVAKLAAAGLPADQLLETADTFSLGRLYGLLEKTRRL